MKRKLLTILMIMLCTLIAQAQSSKVNVTIDGPGVVDEYLTFGANGTKQLKLKAVPSKFLGNVTFDGWSGDATGTSEELTVDADKAQNIHATFTYHRPVKKYPLLNLKQSWAQMGKPMYIEMPSLTESEAYFVVRGHEHLPVDYNRDGYIDYIEFPMRGPNGIDNERQKVRFWLGKPDGSFEEDPLNDNRILGTVYSIHIKYADLNDDGFPDFCSFSTGYDREPSSLDYPVILMSSPDGRYTDLRFEDWGNAYFHGGEVGDIDNDGDIDVVFLDMGVEWTDDDHSLLLINDGKGNFTRKHLSEIIDFSEIFKRYSSPNQRNMHGDLNIYDLNNDGYNDLCFTGSDSFNPDGSDYVCSPMILWGNSSGIFGGPNYSELPKCRLGYSICEDMAFYDINGDGVKEIILERNGDGQLGGTRFYTGGYLQVCEWEKGQYVDKTEHYIPVEHQGYNKSKSETCLWIEKIDGTDYLCTTLGTCSYYEGVGVGQSPIYAIRNGKLMPVEGYTTTKIPSFDEGLPIYVDGIQLTDIRQYFDGVNEADLLTEWAAISDWDPVTGNMWRINFAHRQDTHTGRTCIRWNRDGQNPSDPQQRQAVDFWFVSDVDFSKLKEEGYFLELYIKNSDVNLTLLVNGHEIGANDTDEGIFTGQWQRMSFPLRKISGETWHGFTIDVKEGNLSNEFYLDDIRIRRLADSGIDDYDRTFMQNYLDETYRSKERTAQIKSQEFKSMLKLLIQKFAPDSMTYFNNYITDEDIPLTRGMATVMAYYTARSIGAETDNARYGDTPADMWDIDDKDYDRLLPHWRDDPETDFPEDKYWRGAPFSNWMAGWWWNNCHESDQSGIQVIALDKKANSFHMNDPLTWEDAIRAITRLYDSLDPEIVVNDISSPRVVVLPTRRDTYYNLKGQLVNGRPTKMGVYILNGKKVVIK